MLHEDRQTLQALVNDLKLAQDMKNSDGQKFDLQAREKQKLEKQVAELKVYLEEAKSGGLLGIDEEKQLEEL